MKYLLLALVLCSCSNPPQAKTVEVDLCKARDAFRSLEDIDPSLQPPASSAREGLERAEDAFCATVRP